MGRKKVRRYMIRIDSELDNWLTKFANAIGRTPTEVIRTAIDLLRLYYLGEGVKEGQGLAAIQHLLEGLAARAYIIGSTSLKEKRE